jgi:hypothetical protein
MPLEPSVGGQAPNGLEFWDDRTKTPLEVVTYEFAELQDRAEKSLPIGWCNGCVAAAKVKEEKGEPAEPIRAAVTTIAQVQQIEVPVPGALGQKIVQPVVMALPSCIFHIGLDKSGSRKVQPSNGRIALPGSS